MKPFLPLAFALALTVGCRPGSNPVGEVTVESSGVKITASNFATAADSDWASWRGPAGNGIAIDQPIPTSWSADKNVIWHSNVPGRGHGSPIVSGDQVFLATADERKQEQSIVAFSREDGALRWQTTISVGGFPGSSQMHTKSTHANGTLACDGSQLYCAFLANGEITAVALDLDGNEIWKRVICTFNSKFGYAPSPALYKSTVIFAADNHGGGCIAALDRKSGKIVWKTKKFRAGYGSAVHFLNQDQQRIAVLNNDVLLVLDPADGREVAHYPWETSFATSATTPIVSGTTIFLSTGYKRGCTLLELTGDKLRQTYENKNMANHMANCVLWKGHLYGFSGNAHTARLVELTAIDYLTGEKKWSARGLGCGSLMLADGKLICLSDKGELVIIAADPKERKEFARTKILDGKCWTVPVLSGGRVYARNSDGDVVCVDLRK